MYVTVGFFGGGGGLKSGYTVINMYISHNCRICLFFNKQNYDFDENFDWQATGKSYLV